MIKLFQILFLGHAHVWKTVDNGTLGNKKGQVTGRWYIQECTKCGIVKRRNLRADD